MYFATVTQWLQMGGYALYVWPTYGIALIILAANVVLPLHRRRRLRDKHESEAP